ncbi:hypothetical protein K435DRAFT_750308 [Dendrothele bispora CBS 962.96]|uniref:CSC1/OSCA1-like 7TM region domain-containing protein n=1 Tax=Dendrothele bispora (strain CBS 962.96) TaxID=1314807 RepID=A0A4S8MFM9_DENBC|nr:hypothetical protein K435DRAFT_750308 [Dendrothele bispora CBS 962.96]
MNDLLIYPYISPSNLPPIARRPHPNDALTPLEAWWTTSGGSTFIPSATTQEPSSQSSVSDHSDSSSNPPTNSTRGSNGSGGALTTFTSSVAVSTFTQDSTTFTSFTPSVITSSLPSFTTSVSSTASRSQSASAGLSSTTPGGQLEFNDPVCIGDGIDSISDGVLASIVLPSAIGLIIWLIFAIVRPRFRQIYALREWFVQQDLRPKPLGNGLFAFLHPPVPLVPDTPDDVSDAGRSATEDVELFPSDEQLSQRALWMCFLIALGWSFLGLAGALPLYLVDTPCLADQGPQSTHGGSYSALHDLSLLRLLRYIDNGGNVSVANLISVQKRADGSDPQNIRPRIIVLTVLTIVLALLPALWKITKEFNNLAAYRKRWIETKCQNKEMGWLSVRDAPGFKGWGEKRLKDFILKSGLSSSLDQNGGSSRNGNGRKNQSFLQRSRHGDDESEPFNESEKAGLEVDVQSLFTVCDTHQLALLIDERDEILDSLEIAEAKYINSFRLTTPDPSIADFEPPEPRDPDRPYISRPKPLGGNGKRSRGSGRRSKNPAFAASSLAPTSFVAPSQYYRLRNVSGINGGRFTSQSYEKSPSMVDEFGARIVGSRFQEVNRTTSARYQELPLGSHVHIDQSGELGPLDEEISLRYPDPRHYGPNHGIEESDLTENDGSLPPGEEWIDLSREAPPDVASVDNGEPMIPPKRRSQRQDTSSPSKRETFPFRNKDLPPNPDEVPPPHLRLQPTQPFVRPMEGINFDQLGLVYGDITQWRTKLKTINAEIADAQRNSYQDIADGVRVKGWLLVGQGLRHIPNVQIIEGRAKEDIRWDVLQNERSLWDVSVMWAMIGLVAIFLAAGLTAAAALSLATAPDVGHFLPFLQPLLSENALAAGIVTVFIPAFAALLFVSLALIFVRWAAENLGSVSISGGQLLVYKTTFLFLTLVTAILIIVVGALLFSMQAFSTGSTPSRSVASGSIYMAALALTIIIQIAIIFPGVLLLQPLRLWHVLRAEKHAVTPRQRFRAVYPRTYDPSYSTCMCILAVVFASTFALIFPLIGPAVVVLLFLTLIAHRFLVGYVYARTHSQTGGELQLWLMRRFGTLLSFQPILLGLIFLSQDIWIEGGVLVGVGVMVILFVESYTRWKTRLPGRSSLSAITRNSLETFEGVAKRPRSNTDEEGTSLVSSPTGRARGSMASVLEMMSLTLAVMPSPTPARGPVPLQTETLDDMTATERCSRTNPDAPPHLPPLPFGDHADEMAGILYAPELVAPSPIIWLPNDNSGVARSEAIDLQKYHDLRVVIDVRGKEHGQLHPLSSRDSAGYRT